MLRLIKQLFRFGIVGVICFLIDYGLMILFTETAGINYLVSCIMSFTLSNIVNYILSVKFVFDAKSKNIIIFYILSGVGLGLTSGFMYLFTDICGMHYTVSKIIVTGVVAVFNFVTRKIYMEREHRRLKRPEKERLSGTKKPAAGQIAQQSKEGGKCLRAPDRIYE